MAAPQGPAETTAASPAPPRVFGFVDESRRVTLHGNLLLPASLASDRGAVEESAPAGRMLLLLSRSAVQESALQDFIQAAHAKGNPAFHKWLRPEQFGRMFGPADSDVAAVVAWLESHGLTVNKVHAGREAIEFSGTAGQLREAFQTQIHSYMANSQRGGTEEPHLAATEDPSVPSALAPVIAGVSPLNNIHPRPHLKVMGSAGFNPKNLFKN